MVLQPKVRIGMQHSDAILQKDWQLVYQNGQTEEDLQATADSTRIPKVL